MWLDIHLWVDEEMSRRCAAISRVHAQTPQNTKKSNKETYFADLLGLCFDRKSLNDAQNVSNILTDYLKASPSIGADLACTHLVPPVAPIGRRWKKMLDDRSDGKKKHLVNSVRTDKRFVQSPSTCFLKKLPPDQVDYITLSVVQVTL